MKSVVKISAAVLLTVILVVSQGCKKPKPPKKDPCADPKRVIALTADYHSIAHFSYTGADNIVQWLYANNWSRYASQVTEGQEYDISYREVPCDNGCGDYLNKTGDNNILPGGCVLRPSKCIEITCLKPVIKRCPDNCLSSEVVDYDKYQNLFSEALTAYAISGNNLKLRLGYSGCSEDQYTKYKLYLVPGPSAGPLVNLFEAKAVNAEDFVVCDAYFEKDICFDLSGIRTYYAKHNMVVPQTVSINLTLRDGTVQTLQYNP